MALLWVTPDAEDKKIRLGKESLHNFMGSFLLFALTKGLYELCQYNSTTNLIINHSQAIQKIIGHDW